MTTRPRGARVIQTFVVNIATDFPSGVSAGTYGEVAASLDLPSPADEIWILNSADGPLLLAKGAAASEEDLFGVPNSATTGGEFSQAIRLPNVFQNGDRIAYTPAPGSSTVDAGALVIAFVALYRP